MTKSKICDDGQAWAIEIDERERRTLNDSYTRMRQEESRLESEHCKATAFAKMASIMRESPWRELRLEAGGKYHVEGELGVWSFTTWRVVDTKNEKIIYDTRASLPLQRGKKRHCTTGYRELLLFFGMESQSCRQSSKLLSRLRHQYGGRLVAATSVRDLAEAEGLAMEKSLNDAVEVEMEKLIDATPPAPPPQLERVRLELAVAAAEIPPELLAEAYANTVPITPPESTVEISPDAVFCKKQKEMRKENPDLLPESKTKSERKTVSTCCATVEFKNKRITLAARAYMPLCMAVAAVLSANRLLGMHACLLSDGETKLRDDFMPALRKVVASLHHVLDWYHLAKRCAALLSSACKGKDIRNMHKNEILRFLWFGCVDSAIDYVKAIPDGDLKSPKHRDTLVEYLSKRKGQIPVYAVRRQLGLPNSSNAVEKANDRLVSTRQKGKGMSWSQDGSSALAMIRMTTRNGQTRLWLDERKISLEFLRDAA